ncbi:MAG: NAD(P)-dependent oxidoreductase, partial [Candidatus Marinimicrobia bacterium]|nr:NAD(P)-dependent oxidoreductase [Candidatus Neomarinimicrobiota bacterium]
MKKIGIIGLGDMGIGMAANLLKKGFELSGFDLREDRLNELARLGGRPAGTCQEVAENSDVVFIMVLNGQQVKEVVLGETGILKGLKPGSTIIVSATINPSEVKDLEQPILAMGINLIDSPVSGGKSGADNGTLTLMTAAKKEVFEDCKNVLEAVGQNIFHVGEEIGIG